MSDATQDATTPRAVADDAQLVCVFAPVTLLTITLEQSPDGNDELHIHPGGQGVWTARMVRTLGGHAVLCTALSGETGDVIRHLLGVEGIRACDVPAAGPNAAWLHDRRDGERQPIWEGDAPTLGRHDLDELYSITLGEAMAAGVCMLAGSHESKGVIPSEIYERLAADLDAAGVRTVADLSGSELQAALAGGLHLVKISHEELVGDGWANDDTPAGLLRGIDRLREAGARNVVVSRASSGAIAAVDDAILEIEAPELEVADARGAGDSMSAALSLSVGRGDCWEDTLRLAAAAGGVNVTRHGSGSGRAETVAQLAERVAIRPLAEARP